MYLYMYYTVYIIHKYTAILLFTLFRSRLGFIIVRIVCTKTRVGRYHYIMDTDNKKIIDQLPPTPLYFSAQ